ncbi:hypothetical protein PHAMO_180082 [Magnetospirillum molischianum DSM 120]|uniref:Uncharacterized protein n=1 Tax=Magnetospirillum molischianum DSM 120 TaxID=1150626 RepID=H8FP25_MAGML|nr:hypothetical protein PHAMO_180082 [Magnetospirillum molischianum DSM 120]
MRLADRLLIIEAGVLVVLFALLLETMP